MSFLTKVLLEPEIRRIENDDTINIKDIKISKPDLAGAHFATGVDTAEITISSENTENDDRVINLFIKRPAQSDFHQNMMTDFNIFTREAEVYNKLLPKFLEFSRSEDVKLKECIPVSYFASDDGPKSCIVLENLALQGYKMRRYHSADLQDIDHVTLALTALARTHAISYCMKQHINFLDEYPCISEVLFIDDPNGFLETFIKPMFQIPLFLFEESTKIRKDLDKFSDLGFKHLVKLCQPVEPFNVVNHGDFWSNNMMFKYDENGKPVSVKVVDWQGTRFNSVAVDLCYYFFTSTTCEFRKKNLVDMLKVYYEEFTNVAKKLGCENVSFTFADLYEEYMSKRFIGFSMTPGLLLIGLQSKGDHSDPDDLGATDFVGSFSDAIKKIIAVPEKKEMMIKILTDVHKEVEELIDQL